jgi:hypothetical protein
MLIEEKRAREFLEKKPKNPEISYVELVATIGKTR